MGLFGRKHKKEKKQAKTSQQPSQSEGRPYESGGPKYGEPGHTQSGQPGQYGQYGSTQQRYDQQPQAFQQQPETGQRSAGDYQSGGGGSGYGTTAHRTGSTGYNPAPYYGPSSRYRESSGGKTEDTYEGRNEQQYERTGSQKRDERSESGRRTGYDLTQGTPGRYPDTYRAGGYGETGGGTSGGYMNRPYEGEGGGYKS